MALSADANDDFLFIDDNEEDEILDDQTGDSWKVLIVDDDPEIHSVTQLALSDLIVLGQRLEYLHAYSGKDACQIIEDNEDIVLVLLDVVMETDDAGLNVVKHIRDVLLRSDIRIVLRTGQPGCAPEESVIKDYDINDYKTKTELTRRKLVTTVYAAIRSYQQISSVIQNRIGLEKIIKGAGDLLELRSVHEYAQGVISQSQLLTHGSKGLFCARGQGIIDGVDGVDDLDLYVLSQNGYSSTLINQRIDRLKDDSAQRIIYACFQNKEHQITTEYIALYLSSGGYRAVIYIKLEQELTKIELQLIEVFLANVAIGYENINLFQKLRYKDWLTHLPNRLEFVSLLDRFGQPGPNHIVAGLIDINHFSDINDGLGQDIGNQLLVAVTTRLKALSDKCTFARVGADVFGVIGPADVVNADKLSALFNQPFRAGEQNLPINACFGFCEKDDAGSRGVNILNQINIALNLAKKNQIEHFVYYKKEMEERTLWRLSMISQLRADFTENRLELWYQPQFNLNTDKVIGAEALLRWKTADGKYISPAVFIPLAEYSGLIIDIGDWVVNQACQQIKTLENNGFNEVSISVNVSIPQFRRSNFVDSVIKATKNHAVEPNKLELEITENILMDDPEMVINSLIRVKAEGISIALDDFGTGYSSLSYLQKLPLDRLKIDRAFVTDIAQSGESIIADTIINIGKKMNLKVIAEGVEDEEQRAHLISQGCDEVQGFFYAKPMPADQFLAFLKNNY